MSEFTFTNDLAGGTATSVADTPETGLAELESKAGSATESYATCSIKKLLATMRANSTVTVCGDLRIQEGDLYLQADGSGVGGAAGSSLIKEIGLVYGKFDDNGDFEMLDPNPSDDDFRGQIDDTEEDDNDDGSESDLKEDIGPEGTPNADESVTDGTLEHADTDELLDTRGGKWYFRVVRPEGDIKYIAIEPLNNLIDALAVAGDETKSILGLVKDLAALQNAIKEAIESEFSARVQDVDDLEIRLDADITSLRHWILDMEYRVSQYAADEDLRLTAELTAREVASGQKYRSDYEDVRLQGSIELGQITTECANNSGVEFTSPYEIKEAHKDIKKWMIQASVMDVDPDGPKDDDGNLLTTNPLRLRGDLDLFFDAVIEEGAEGGDYEGSYRLRVTSFPVQCEDESGLTLSVKAIWCGDQPNMPDEAASFSAGGYTSVPAITVNTGNDADADQGGKKLAEVAAPTIPEDAVVNGEGVGTVVMPDHDVMETVNEEEEEEEVVEETSPLLDEGMDRAVSDLGGMTMVSFTSSTNIFNAIQTYFNSMDSKTVYITSGAASQPDGSAIYIEVSSTDFMDSAGGYAFMTSMPVDQVEELLLPSDGWRIWAELAS